MDLVYIKPTKIFYHPDRIKAYLNEKLVKPITVKIYLTDNCNLACYYCVYKDRLSKEEISLKNAKIVLNKLKEMNVKGLVFTGGEPTYYKDYREVMKYAFNLDFDLGLTTNGVIYPNALEFLTWLRFSLDTIKRDTFKKIKGKDKVYEVHCNIDKAVKEKYNKNYTVTIGIQMVVTVENYLEMIDMVEYANSMRVDYCQIRPLENFVYSKRIWDSIQEQFKTIKETDYGIEIITTDYKWEELRNDYRRTYKGCPGADFIGAVDVKGDFYICCTTVKDKTAKYGNLLTDNIKDILKKRKKIQDNFNYNKCPIACQGSLMNKMIAKFKKIKHRNFV